MLVWGQRVGLVEIPGKNFPVFKLHSRSYLGCNSLWISVIWLFSGILHPLGQSWILYCTWMYTLFLTPPVPCPLPIPIMCSFLNTGFGLVLWMFCNFDWVSGFGHPTERGLHLHLMLWFLERGNGWQSDTVDIKLFFFSFFFFFWKTGKKAVKAVLWVSADGLRVVDEKTKVRFHWTEVQSFFIITYML